jgi:nicotinamidase-related amidase
MARHDEDSARIGDCAPGGVGLLIIDMINGLAFPGGAALKPQADRIATNILALRDQADRLRIPVIYVNDNYGQWHSERSRIVAACADEACPGRDIVLRLAPRDDDFFVIKPQFSGFYSTNLPVLLPKLGVSRLVLTGLATDICVLFTAADAHMREYELWVPTDTVASEADERTAWALEIMRNSMGAETRATADLALAAWVGDAGG